MTRYAWREVLVTIVVGALLTAVVAHYARFWALAPAVVAVALLAFYRDPPRRVPQEDDVLVAPADGKLVRIDRDMPGDAAAKPTLRLTIFLSVFDVHVNRSPCAGTVTNVDYRPGRFVNAMRDAASACNECSTLTIAPRPPLPGPVLVRQIAGILARRIVCAAKPGDALAAGQRFGMIKLGSRTELCVPDEGRWEVLVRIGEHVSGGLTILARLRPDKSALEKPAGQATM